MIFNATDLTLTAKNYETFRNIFVRGNAENGILRGFIAKTSTKITSADGQKNCTEDCAMGEGHKTEPKRAAVDPIAEGKNECHDATQSKPPKLNVS